MVQMIDDEALRRLELPRLEKCLCKLLAAFLPFNVDSLSCRLLIQGSVD
jgi:hypothetical protein